MAVINCGARIRTGTAPIGTAGCLVRFKDTPNQVLLLTAGHVVLSTTAKQGDPIAAPDLGISTLGLLLTWTSLEGSVTADAALIWVNPSLISPSIMGIGRPDTTPAAGVQQSQILRIFSSNATARQMKVDRVTDDVPVIARGPDWSASLNYLGQIVCKPEISQPGDSGAIVVDNQNRVVGMVVAGSDGDGTTIVTPISAILQNTAWGGGELEVLDNIPLGAVAPPMKQPSQNPGTQRVDLSSLSPMQKLIAHSILDSFATAGFGLIQQVAALANAIAESSLQPAKCSPPPEDSVGLFQLNRKNGSGVGYEVVQLQDPKFNIQIVIDAVSKISAFKTASSLDDAVSVFVRNFERPKNVDAEVVLRQRIARSLFPTAG